MAGSNCPEWDYKKHPGFPIQLQDSIRMQMESLSRPGFDWISCCCDTRPLHRELFGLLTPQGFEYYAGNFRGSRHHCLVKCEVGVGGDPLVGTPAAFVEVLHQEYAQRVASGFAALEAIPAAISPQNRIVAVANFLAFCLEFLLRIHPYMDGNGHTARFVVLSIAARFGYRFNDWPIDPRPSDQRYVQGLYSYRRNNLKPLVNYLISILSRT